MTPFQFVTLTETLCPEALGWAIRERWDEVLAWRGPGPAQSLSPTPDDYARQTSQPACGNGEPVADNPDEQTTFRAFTRVTGSVPGDRDALRFWYLEHVELQRR